MKERAQKILDQWQLTTVGQLTAGLEHLLENVSDVLIDFASESESMSVQTAFYDAQREFFIKGRATISPFRQNLLLHKNFFTGPSTQTSPDNTTLSLLDQDNYEISLALDTIAQSCIVRNQQNYHALRQRLSALSGGGKIQLRNIPLNPQSVTSAFRDSIAPLTIANPVLLVLLTLFDRYVISKLDTALSAINHELAVAGILPTIKYTVNQRSGSSSEVKEVSHTQSKLDNESAMQSDSEMESRFAPPTPGVPTSEESLKAISRLLGKQRRLNASGEPGTEIAKTNLPRINEAIRASEQEQQFNNPEILSLATQGEKLVIDKQLLIKIRRTLKQQRMLIKSMAGQKNIAEQEQNAIDIIGMLFEAILDDNAIPPPVKTLLSHLHTPMLKIAVNDPSLLQNKNHPARVLLDAMLRVGVRWVDPESPQNGILPALEYCVRKITDNPRSIDYEHLHAEIEKREKQLKQRKNVSEKRILDAEKGQARLVQAKNSANSATQTLLTAHNLPTTTRVFLQTIFTDYLSLLLLRNDMQPDHPNCQTALNSAIRMIQEIDQKNFGQAKSNGQALGQLITTLLPHYASNINDYLNQIAYSRAPEVTETSPTDQGTENTIEDDINPKLQSEGLALVPGSWLLWQEKPDSLRSIKLIWTNPHTKKLLFVDQNGNKVAHMHAHQVGAALQNGTLSLALSKRKESGFDHLLYKIRRKLERTGNPAGSNT